MKINGHSISLPTIVIAVSAVSWLSGLSYQGMANAEDLEKLEKVPVEIALMRQEQGHIKNAIDAIARALGVEVVANTTIPVVVKDDE